MSLRTFTTAPYWGKPPEVATATQADRLRQARVGLAAAAVPGGTATNHLIFIGDSITQGQVATSRDRSYLGVCRARLNTLIGHGPTLGAGHCPAGSTVFGTPKWTITAGSPLDIAVGLPGAGVQIGLGDAVAITTTCRRVLLNYRKINDVTATSLRVNDGASVLATIVSHDATAGAGNYRGIWDSGDLGANASRTITVTGVNGAGNPGQLVAGYFLGDGYANEVCCWNGGLSGYDAAEWLARGVTATDMTTGLSLAIGSANINFVIELGINDVITYGSSPGAVAQFRDRLIQLATQLRSQTLNALVAAGPASIVFIVPWRILGISEGAWDPYRGAIYSAADATNSAVLDAHNLLGGALPGLTLDGIHPLDVGHQALGNHLAQLLVSTY